jgi:DNA mismatch endonuclease (patch repair protein)
MGYKFKTSAARSELMQKIKSKDTVPELLFAKALRHAKIRYTRKSSQVVGKPDFILASRKVAIFIDGEFWHGFKWRDKKPKIKGNRAYWIPKIERNIARDRKNNRALKADGWAVVRFWERQLRKDVAKCIQKIKQILEN